MTNTRKGTAAQYAEDVGEQIDVHWFTSSVMYWHSGDDLEKVLRRQRREDNSGSLKPKGFNLYRVPGKCDETPFKISNYEPVIDGCEWIAFISY